MGGGLPPDDDGGLLAEEPPEDLVPQFPLMRRAVKAFGLIPVEQDIYEADDLIATYAKQARERGADVLIISADKDLMQLIGPGVAMFDPASGTAGNAGAREERRIEIACERRAPGFEGRREAPDPACAQGQSGRHRVAAKALEGNKLLIDVNADVNETAGIVWDAKAAGGKSGVWILGGGSPKNFLLQTEPQIQEVLGIAEKGHDYFLAVTDARPDTGGLSGATPAEAVSWGKVDPDKLPDSVVCYTDSTIALPLLTAYVLSRVKPRKLKRLYDRRDDLMARLKKAYIEQGRAGENVTAHKG